MARKKSPENQEIEDRLLELAYGCERIVIVCVASAPGYQALINGDSILPIGIFRKLRKQGSLVPEQRGLLDDCPQTYTVCRPDPRGEV